MIDRRLIPDLRYLAAHFAISINEGYAGPLPGNPHKIIGCPRCHVADSDHKNGMAVDIGPRTWSPKCDRHWKGVSRLARVGRAAPEPPARAVPLGRLQRRRRPRLRQPPSPLLDPRRRQALQGRPLGRGLQGGSRGYGRHPRPERRHQRGPRPPLAPAGQGRGRPRQLSRSRPVLARARAPFALVSGHGIEDPCGDPDCGHPGARQRLRLGRREDPRGLPRRPGRLLAGASRRPRPGQARGWDPAQRLPHREPERR